ncbi:hypothetical protein BGW38_001754, partial [Lunasporangiospora selenospora]
MTQHQAYYSQTPYPVRYAPPQSLVGQPPQQAQPQQLTHHPLTEAEGEPFEMNYHDRQEALPPPPPSIQHGTLRGFDGKEAGPSRPLTISRPGFGYLPTQRHWSQFPGRTFGSSRVRVDPEEPVEPPAMALPPSEPIALYDLLPRRTGNSLESMMLDLESEDEDMEGPGGGGGEGAMCGGIHGGGGDEGGMGWGCVGIGEESVEVTLNIDVPKTSRHARNRPYKTVLDVHPTWHVVFIERVLEHRTQVSVQVQFSPNPSAIPVAVLPAVGVGGGEGVVVDHRALVKRLKSIQVLSYERQQVEQTQRIRGENLLFKGGIT